MGLRVAHSGYVIDAAHGFVDLNQFCRSECKAFG